MQTEHGKWGAGERTPRSPKSSVWVHHVLLGLKLQETMGELGLNDCTVRSPDIVPETDPYKPVEDFILKKLR